jgi:tetratricopeptide (TPR) repeat protein
MLEDGTAPTSRVSIQRVCGTSQRTEAYTDSRGYFSFQLGSNTSELIQDASSDSFGLGRDPLSTPTVSRSGSSTGTVEQRLMGCELRAQLPGYQSQSVSLSNRQPMDSPDLGVILLHRLGASEGTTVSATTLAAPKDARKAYEKGLALAKKNKFDEAQTELQKAVALYPHYAMAWCDLGRVQASLGKPDEARKSFDQSIQADQKYVPPYVDIARLQLRAKQWQ